MSFPGGFSQNLFGNVAHGMRLPQQQRNLVEFKAGKMTMTGKLVKPDERKGLIYIYQGDDGLTHFCWKDRGNGNLEDDLIIFPEDVSFNRVSQCTTGRVYVLKFRNSTRKLFFWMQDAKTDKDDIYCSKVNEVLNNPNAAATPAPNAGDFLRMYGLTGANPNLTSMEALDTHGFLRPHSSPAAVTTNNADGQSRSRPATVAPSVTNTSRASDNNAPSPTRQQTTAVQLSDLQNVFAGLSGGDQQQERSVEVDLNQLLDDTAISSISSNSDLLEQLQPFLPPGSTDDSTSRLRETLTSPPFQQALSSFSAALQSGQLGSMMNQLGMSDATDAARQGDIAAFARALENAARAGTLQDNTPPPAPSSENDASSAVKEGQDSAVSDTKADSSTEKNNDKDNKDAEEHMDVDP